MGLTSSLFAGLSGMKTNEFRMDVIGNNIANVNTYGFKSSRASFQSQFYNTFSFGTAASGATGGSNPMQVGTGVTVGGVTRDFTAGAPETTGIKTDLAVQGQGLFIVEKANGSVAYTRDGSFQFNSENYLLTSDGYFLQGYGVDNNFNIVEGTLTNLRIPIGEITTAATTSEAAFSGNLNAGGEATLDEDGFANGNVCTILDTIHNQSLSDAGGPLADTTLLTDLQVDGVNVLLEGNIITLKEAIKGGQTIPEETLTVEATTTLGEFMDWLEQALGINTSPDQPDFTGDPNPIDLPGVTINATGDGIQIVGNIGEANTLELGNKAIEVSKGTAAADPVTSLPFTFSTDGSQQTEVESVRTSFTAYDSLGNPMDIDLTFVLLDKNASGTVWRFYAESSDDSDVDRVLGSGTVSFDTNGSYLEGTDLVITIDREGTGAGTPQTITLDFSAMKSYKMNSAVSLLSQDGFQAGTLQDFSVGSDGTITGSFTNGLTRTLGQVVLATFRNYEGLVAQTDNLYVTGPNSGDAIVKQPQELGAGSISSAALELSNVDLSREFINLIVSSTGFSASSRVIQTSNQLLTELMMLGR